jgi:hypothetical protein
MSVGPIDIHSIPAVNVVDSHWMIFAACASAAAAIATFIMALYTRTLATETSRLAEETHSLAAETLEGIKVTREAIDAEDERHKDSFMPHLLLEVHNVPSQLVNLGAQGTRRTPPAMELHVRNIGVGFAQNIVVEAPNRAAATKVIIDNRPAALGVGLVEPLLLISQELDAEVRVIGYTLKYDDAFGRKFESRIEGEVTVESRYEWKRIDKTPTARTLASKSRATD